MPFATRLLEERYRHQCDVASVETKFQIFTQPRLMPLSWYSFFPQLRMSSPIKIKSPMFLKTRSYVHNAHEKNWLSADWKKIFTVKIAPSGDPTLLSFVQSNGQHQQHWEHCKSIANVQYFFAHSPPSPVKFRDICRGISYSTAWHWMKNIKMSTLNFV